MPEALPYPVIVACIAGRRPNREEFRAVARRIWQESLALRRRKGFAAKRRLFLATRAALNGTPD